MRYIYGNYGNGIIILFQQSTALNQRGLYMYIFYVYLCMRVCVSKDIPFRRRCCRKWIGKLNFVISKQYIIKIGPRHHHCHRQNTIMHTK